jgi:HD-GYP domain-containing protein (c-di-GMP phosphodiesterase class II)/DNA-binding LacI/PurR family transcriptional regulator
VKPEDGSTKTSEYELETGIRAMNGGSSGNGYLFGVLIDAIVSPYQKNIAEELFRAAEGYGSRLIFFLGGRIKSGLENEDRMKYVYQLISRESIDGLILVSNCLMCDKSTIMAYLRMFQSLPMINIGHEIPGKNNIIIDNSSGVRQIVRHLVEFHNAKKFAFVGGVESHPDAMERYQTFLRTLKELDIPFDPDLYYAGDFEQDSGSKAVRVLFNKCMNMDTIVAANDHMAIGVMETLQKMGKRIPEDIRVAGFDNIPDSSFCMPGLTTAGQPFAQLGRKAIESLIQLAEKKEIPERVVLPVDLIIRQSCGCCPQAIVDNKFPAFPMPLEDDVQLLTERAIQHLLPEFGPSITDDIKKTVLELVQTPFIPAKDEGEVSRNFLYKWNAIIDEILLRAQTTEFLERLLMEINQSIVSGMIQDRSSYWMTSVLLQNAWFLLLKKLINLEKTRQYRHERDDIILQFFRAMTAMGSSEEEVTSSIRYYIPRLGIHNFFLAKFESAPDRVFESARIILCQCQDPDAVISKDVFPSNQLIPGGIRPLRIKSNWVVEAISLYDEIGFIVLEMSNRNVIIYSQIRTIVSSYLQEYILVDRLQKQTVNLQKQSEELTKNVDYLRQIMGAVIQTLSMMVEAKDPYTAGHERRVADLARSIAREMGLPFEKTEAVRLSSIIHDIGKLYIPSEILNKPGKLLEAEFSLIKLHPKIAFDILKNIEFPWPLAEIVYQHHERCDGSGYPRGLKGDEILLESRIIAIADVVEAMASHRPYRPSRGIEAALKEISDNRGSKYDPEIVDICLKLFMEKGYNLKD